MVEYKKHTKTKQSKTKQNKNKQKTTTTIELCENQPLYYDIFFIQQS